MKGAKIKALCLLSGGLDSSLAAKVVRDQGIEVIGVNFIGPFSASADQGKGSAGLDLKGDSVHSQCHALGRLKKRLQISYRQQNTVSHYRTPPC